MSTIKVRNKKYEFLLKHLVSQNSPKISVFILVNRVLNYQKKTIKKSLKQSNKLLSWKGLVEQLSTA